MSGFRRSCTVLLALTLALLPALPAQAATASLPDAGNDVVGVPYIDLTSVQIKHTKKTIKVTYYSRSKKNNLGHEWVDFDTNRNRKGPELKVNAVRYSEWWAQPMKNWRADESKAAKRKWTDAMGGKPGRCITTVRYTSNWSNGYSPTTITVSKKRGCLTGKSVRVRVGSSVNGYDRDFTYFDTFGTKVSDSLPNGSRTFTKWVKQRGSKAKTRKFVDGKDSVIWWSDIRSVGVAHNSTQLAVKVNHLKKPSVRQGRALIYLNTDADAQPEYKAMVGGAGPTTLLLRMQTWDQVVDEVACATTGESANTGQTATRIQIPVSCIGNPATVRIAVATEDWTGDNYRPTDWLGKSRGWSRSIGRG